MSEADDLGGFASPPFDAKAALQQIQRALRDLKLAERGNGFELRGRRVAELELNGAAIETKLARRAALTPEWDRQRITSTAAQRKWLDDARKRLARWESED